MEFINPTGGNYILKIHKKSDSEVYQIKPITDIKMYNVNLSNKGDYSVYLGHFHTLYIIDNSDLEYSIYPESDYSKFYEEFKFTPNVLEVARVIRGKDYIFEDLKTFSGPNLVKSFKRLAAIAYYANGNLDEIDDVKYGLDFLMHNWYQGLKNYTGNWWDYEIGAMKSLVEALVLVYGYIDKEIVFDYLNTSRFYLACPEYLFYRRNYPNIKRELATGANLLDNLYIAVLRSILQENKTEMDKYFREIDDALREVSCKDGFYADGGFIQHGSVPYNASYGEVVLNSTTKLLNIFYLLGYDCNFYLERMVSLIKKAYLPFMYDGRTVESVRGRSQSRLKGDSSYSYDIMMAAIKKLNCLFHPAGLDEMIYNDENRIYKDEALVFNSINRYIRRNDKYLLSINANSSYINNYESILEENICGDYQSNFTYDILYNFENKLPYPKEAYINHYFRNGSTNTMNHEESDMIIENKMTSGVMMDGIILSSWDQNSDVCGHHTKLVFENSMLALGSEIKSSYPFTTTYLNTLSDLRVEGSSYFTGKIRLVTNDNVKAMQFSEDRSLYDINHNNTDIKYTVNGVRILSENESEYEYQLYPYYENICDEYEYIKLENTHIVKYKNYICISSFNDKEVDYKNLHFRGIFSAILKLEDEEILMKLSTGSREERVIDFKIDGFKSSTNNLVVNNENIITIRYKEAILLED